jgi:hypothetical protein
MHRQEYRPSEDVEASDEALSSHYTRKMRTVSQNVYLLSRRGPVYRRMPAVFPPTATR